MRPDSECRLAIVTTHPVQYYAPWFCFLASSGLQLQVFYLDHPAERNAIDPEFGAPIQWDTPLLGGYASSFVPNRSRRPGSHHYFGLHNPSLLSMLRQFAPTATLLMAYHYRTLLPALLRRSLPAPLFLRGDSHLLSRQSGWRRGLADAVIRRAFGALDGALYVGQNNRDYFLHHGLTAEQLHHSPPAIDLCHFTPSNQTTAAGRQWREQLGIASSDTLLLFVGKFIDKKRPLDLVRAFKRSGLDRCSLLMVGDGPLEGALREAARGQDKVFFAPFQNQSLMPRTYAAGDLLVLPSLDFETWGLVVNEAFAMGVPALVSDRVGCGADLVRGRDTGMEFPAADIAALTGAICAAAANRQRLRDWGTNAQSLVQREFHYGAMSQGLFTALRSQGPVCASCT